MDKKVDSEWKKKAQEEKEKMAAEAEKQGEQPPEASFLNFVSGLTAQAMVALGQMQDPVSGEIKKDLTHARYFIDTLEMFEEKTEGNLTSEEERALQHFLHQLRMAFVQASKDEPEEESKIEIET